MDETTQNMFREDDPQAAAELLGKLERGSQAAWEVPEQAWARDHQVLAGASDMARELHDQLLDAQHWTVESHLREPGESAQQFAERYQVGAEEDEPEWARVTEDTRRIALAAGLELQRRHPEAGREAGS